MKIKFIFFVLFFGLLQASEQPVNNSEQQTPETNSLNSLFNVTLNLNNSNSNVLSSEMQQTTVQKQTNEQTVLLDPRLLALGDAVRQHWIKGTCCAIGAGMLGSYLLLIAYIMRNKSWIHYDSAAWHSWRNDVSIDTLRQIDAHLTAQELWKTIQNKYPKTQAADLLTLFINETSQEIERLKTFIDTCDTVAKRHLSSIVPSIAQSHALAMEKLSRLHIMQYAINSTVVAALTNPI